MQRRLQKASSGPEMTSAHFHWAFEVEAESRYKMLLVLKMEFGLLAELSRPRIAMVVSNPHVRLSPFPPLLFVLPCPLQFSL